MNSAAKVGLFMLVVLGIAAFFILRIEDIQVGDAADTKKIDVIFDSVAGLEKKSRVRVAGVPVGKVTDIKLQPDGRARVTLEVSRDVQLRQGASARVANLGLLGEKYIELEPGNAGAPLIPENQQVTLGGSQTASVDDVTSQVSAIATDVKVITEALRGALGGVEGQQRVEDIFANVHQITERVRMIIEINEGNLNASAANFRKITDDLRVEIPRIASSIERFANSISGTVGENRQDVREVVSNLKELSSDLRVTAENLNNITGQVKSGEGSVGKLFYSDEAHTKLTDALGAVEGGVNELRETLGRANRIQMDVGIRSDYYAGMNAPESAAEGFDGSSRSAVTLNLIPNPERNRFYYLEVSDDPRGKKKEKITTLTEYDAAGNEIGTTTTKQTKYERDMMISAQAGWQFDDIGLRVGLFDNMGGFGADYRLNDRISVTGEAFDFGGQRDDSPHLRLFGRYVIRQEKDRSPAIFVSTGLDNPLNDTAFTIGGGIRWRDEDLKYLIGSVPIK